MQATATIPATAVAKEAVPKVSGVAVLWDSIAPHDAKGDRSRCAGVARLF